MKKLLFLYAVCLLLVFPVVANALSVDWIGSRSTGNGIEAAGGWSGLDGPDAGTEPDNNGFEISWAITSTGSGDTLLYHYEYTISGALAGDTDLSKGLSHWFLEVTEPSEATDFTNVSQEFSDDSPKPWVTSGDKNPNPDMPDDGIYGIKWDTTGEDVLTYTVSFDTEKDPVWGDFYAKNGSGGQGQNKIWTTAWNVGFGTDPDEDTIDFTNWIATPDGGIPPLYVIPEPATMLLLGSGLIGFAVSGKKRLKKRKG